MYVIRVALSIKPEERESFLEHMKDETAEVQAWPGCMYYQLYEDVQAEDKFLLYEEWETEEVFDTYRTSDTFKAIGAKIFPMMSENPNSAYFAAEKVGP